MLLTKHERTFIRNLSELRNQLVHNIRNTSFSFRDHNVDLNEIVKKSPYNGASSNDVDWVEKVKMQGRIQKWVDHSISVTINLPSDVTEDLVSKVYQTAWESGCKGCTVYRDGSRDGVLVS